MRAAFDKEKRAASIKLTTLVFVKIRYSTHLLRAVIKPGGREIRKVIEIDYTVTIIVGDRR